MFHAEALRPGRTCRVLPAWGNFDRIYVDEGFTGTSTGRPGLDQALAAVHAGDTLIVPRLDRFARSVPDARSQANIIPGRGARLQIGPAVYDPGGPFGKLFFNILAAFAEFEVDIIRLRTIEGMPGPASVAS